jgi:acetyl-CoA decarbonylase/synthase complex subunit gamma
VKEEAKAQLAESSAPPVRLVTLKAGGYEVKAGNEVVLFRHEKTFYNMPGVFVKVKDDLSEDQIKAIVAPADAYTVNYVGKDLRLDGFAVEAVGNDPAVFAAAVKAVRISSKRPLILISRNPQVVAAGLQALSGECPLVCSADSSNWEALADLVRQHKAALVVSGSSLEELAALTENIKARGVEDLVLDPAAPSMGASLAVNTVIRRLALKKNFRALGYPIIAFAGTETAATQAVAKYAGFIVLDRFAPDLAYPLLVLRQNIYTDPQKPIQVQPGLYPINNPKPESPLLVTTNFSITYFSVANEVEGSGLPAWLLVTDAEGMSVLTAWAAGKFDSERIAKAVRGPEVTEKVGRKRVVIPGAVAVLSGELEAELPGWEICVGPREGVDIPAYIKTVLR